MEKKIFVGTILGMLLVIGILSVFHKGNSIKLNGSYIVYEEPDFQVSEWLAGNYQKDMDNFVSNNYAGHNFNVRLYNQFRYSLFGMSDSVVVGRNGYLYEKPYIEEALGIEESMKVSDEEIQDIAIKIYHIQEEALHQNKAFIFVFTPSKADFERENIPDRYFMHEVCCGENERNYQRLKQAFDELGVIYIDGTELLKEDRMNVPVFYKTGTHWSRSAALCVMDEIAETLDSEYGIRLKNIQISGFEELSDSTDEQDQDLYRLLNVFWAEQDEAYYQPVESVDRNGIYEMPDIFIQGGSFTNKLAEISRDNRLFSECKREFYAVSLNDYNRGTSITTEELNCDELNIAINQADIILLESNVENIHGLNPEMYDVIYGHLTEGMRDAYVELPVSFGIYGEESDGQSFNWAQPDILYGIRPEADWKELCIQLELPTDILHSIYGDDLTGTIEIYINDRFMKAFDYSQPNPELHLNLEELDLREGERIMIEIKAPYSFQPSRDLASEDTRILAYKIRYIGGER